MSSIRPLVTITILTVVGVFLFFKIQEGPELASDANSGWAADSAVPGLQATQSPSTVPPLSAAPGLTNSISGGPAPPVWSTGNEATAPVGASPNMSPSSQTGLPGVPAIPELPTAGQAATPSLPTNIPVAHYSEAVPSATNQSTVAPVAVSGRVPSLGTSTPDLQAITPTPGVGQNLSPYALNKSIIHAALQQGELPRAHLLLSNWYGDPSLPPEEQQEIESLLGQLAGTVIYSTEHRLEPAYTIKAGDTLESIGSEYQVPWQLLAKINGISQGEAIRPGEKIKVIRGPFMALVNLKKGELALLLGGRYAGKFPINVPANSALRDGEWVVEKKLLTPGIASHTSPVAAAKGQQLERMLVLRSANQTISAPKLTMGSSTSPMVLPGTDPASSIQIASPDVEEVYDILSVGSRVVIHR